MVRVPNFGADGSAFELLQLYLAHCPSHVTFGFRLPHDKCFPTTDAHMVSQRQLSFPVCSIQGIRNPASAWPVASAGTELSLETSPPAEEKLLHL